VGSLERSARILEQLLEGDRTAPRAEDSA
jgi:hypothetical protein